MGTYKKRPGGGYKFSCQHGPTECLGNIVHNCVIKYVAEPMPYIKCMMEDSYESLGVKHKLSFIPTVALDGDYSSQNNILKNFLPVLCNQYQGERPQNCVQII